MQGFITSKWPTLIGFALGLLSLAACKKTTPSPNPNANLPYLDRLVANTVGYDSLNKAIQMTSLGNALGNPGSFTFFAPTNAAFSNLLTTLKNQTYIPAASLQALDSADNGASLTALLLFHLLNQSATTTQLGTGTYSTFYFPLGATHADTLRVLNMGISISLIGSDTATIVTPLNQPAGNGYCHTVNTVLIPKNFLPRLLPTIYGRVTDRSSGLDSLATALKLTNLQSSLVQTGLTLFAPSNTAFVNYLIQLGQPNLSGVYNLDSGTTLKRVLNYHLLQQTIKTAAFVNNQAYLTASGDSLTVRVSGGAVSLKTGAGQTVPLVKTDILAGNGVLHTVGEVLKPN